MTGTRRSPGTGGVYSYMTNAGECWYWKATITVNGRRGPVNRRGYLSAEAAHDALQIALGESPPPGSRRSWDCLVPGCFARSVTEAPVLLCVDHRDLLLAQHGRKKAHEPVVYFLRNGNRVKIGWTTNLRGRVSSLSLSLSLPMSAVLATVPGGPAKETDMHGRFASAHLGGEWFEFTPDLEAFVGTLAAEKPV